MTASLGLSEIVNRSGLAGSDLDELRDDDGEAILPRALRVKLLSKREGFMSLSVGVVEPMLVVVDIAGLVFLFRWMWLAVVVVVDSDALLQVLAVMRPRTDERRSFLLSLQ